MNLDNSNNILCDFCNESKAILYCRADSAKLCFNCDREVHSTNQLFKKHTRCLLCNSCNSSPASIFCCTESAVFCQNCDWETHKNITSFHDRRPVEGFNGCPSLSEFMNFLGFEELGKKPLVVDGGTDDEFLDFLVWETPSVVSLDELIVPNPNQAYSQQAMGVPPLPKNRNAVCGKHKEEILNQLREIAKTESNFNGSFEKLDCQVGFESQVHGKGQLKESSPGFEHNSSVPTYETSELKWCADEDQDHGFSNTFLDSFIDMNHLVPDKDSQKEVQSFNNVDMKSFQVHPKAAPRELNSQERDSALSRYKEKKKNRRYDRHIRYESRKVRAESRVRIKGRFAKKDC